jgi:hypothetical protein
MEQLVGALTSLPAGKLLRKLDPSCKPAGSVAINVAALLHDSKAAAAAATDTDASSDQQQLEPRQQQEAAAADQQCAHLSHEHVLCLLKLICCQQLNPKLLSAELAQHATRPAISDQQQPDTSTADVSAAAVAAAHAAGATQQHQQCPAPAVPASNAPAAGDAAAAAAALAEVPVDGLPLTSLDLSGQPLGLAGWQLLLRLMRRTNCLQRLVLSDCSIEATDAGEWYGTSVHVDLTKVNG